MPALGVEAADVLGRRRCRRLSIHSTTSVASLGTSRSFGESVRCIHSPRKGDAARSVQNSASDPSLASLVFRRRVRHHADSNRVSLE